MTLRNHFRLIAEERSSGGAWFWKPMLQLASLFYGLGLFFHQRFYQTGVLKRKAFQKSVISVGNITWGGTGKTPLVEYIARFYINRGNVPLILSRGYGRDETRVLAKQLPEAQVAIGKDRYQAAQAALAQKPADVIILDDGFQHWSIKRDLDVITINVLNPFGNFSLIPRGILREPLSALKRASLVVLTDVNLASRKELEGLKTKIRSYAPKVEFVEAYREALYFYRPGNRERIQPVRLAGERVTTFSGIGTPRSFQMLLNQTGLKTVRNFEFSDHHPFKEKELKEILEAKEASKSGEIVTTEKDFYRSEEAIGKILNPLILKTRLHLTTGETLLHQYLARFAQPRSFSRGEHRDSNRDPRRFQDRNRQRNNNRPFRDRNRWPQHSGNPQPSVSQGTKAPEPNQTVSQAPAPAPTPTPSESAHPQGEHA
jgi:tetraacyldisaccharide 4'-kinase